MWVASCSPAMRCARDQKTASELLLSFLCLAASIVHIRNPCTHGTKPLGGIELPAVVPEFRSPVQSSPTMRSKTPIPRENQMHTPKHGDWDSRWIRH